jgi:4'-phosphopantetheinyl transferase
MNKEMLIGKNKIHVWIASLAVRAGKIQNYASLLSAEENDRAARFRFEKDRNHFIVCRGILRTLLGSYSGEEPAAIRFLYNRYGKPSLEVADKRKTVMFNVSHSGGRALLAFSKKIPLGIDLERIRDDIDFASMVHRFFSAAEAETFFSLSEKLRPEAFFNCWTRKEALIKAKDKGLSLGLDQFHVSLRPGEPACFLGATSNEPDVHNWSLFDLNAGRGFKAALAAKSRNPEILIFAWDS